MATSGVKEFKPLVADLVEQAFLLSGIEPQLQKSQHNKTARMAINLMFADWVTEYIPLWLKRQSEIIINPQQLDYDFAQIFEDSKGEAVDFTGLEDIESGVVLDIGNDNSVLTTERLTAEEYNELRINIIGRPYGFWLERKDPPILHWTYVPQETYRFRFIGVYRPDTVLTHMEHPDIPYRWHGAFVYGLAARLNQIFGADPQKQSMLMEQAMAKFSSAWANEDDRTDLRIHDVSFAGMGAY